MARSLAPEMRAFLGENRFGVLATLNPDGTPQQSVMWYELEGDTILMNTKRGRRKDRNMRLDPRISLCLEDEYRFLAIGGTATLIDDQEIAQADIKRLATRYHGADQAERMARDQFSREHRVTVHMSIEHIRSDGF